MIILKVIVCVAASTAPCDDVVYTSDIIYPNIELCSKDIQPTLADLKKLLGTGVWGNDLRYVISCVNAENS